MSVPHKLSNLIFEFNVQNICTVDKANSSGTDTILLSGGMGSIQQTLVLGLAHVGIRVKCQVSLV